MNADDALLSLMCSSGLEEAATAASHPEILTAANSLETADIRSLPQAPTQSDSSSNTTTRARFLSLETSTSHSSGTAPSCPETAPSEFLESVGAAVSSPKVEAAASSYKKTAATISSRPETPTASCSSEKASAAFEATTLANFSPKKPSAASIRTEASLFPLQTAITCSCSRATSVICSKTGTAVSCSEAALPGICSETPTTAPYQSKIESGVICPITAADTSPAGIATTPLRLNTAAAFSSSQVASASVHLETVAAASFFTSSSSSSGNAPRGPIAAFVPKTAIADIRSEATAFSSQEEATGGIPLQTATAGTDRAYAATAASCGQTATTAACCFSRASSATCTETAIPSSPSSSLEPPATATPSLETVPAGMHSEIAETVTRTRPEIPTAGASSPPETSLAGTRPEVAAVAGLPAGTARGAVHVEPAEAASSPDKETTLSVALSRRQAATCTTCVETAEAAFFSETTVTPAAAISPPETATTPGSSSKSRTAPTVERPTSAASGTPEFRSSLPCPAVSTDDLFPQRLPQRTADGISRGLGNEKRSKDGPVNECRVVTDTLIAGAGTPPCSPVGAESSAGETSSGRPQRPRRAPRKFDLENADPDASLKKALEKSLLETRRVEVDYASLQSIPEIKISSFAEFLVNPVAFYERLERYGREFGGVKVVPPEGWKPPFSLRDLLDDELEFNVRAQDIHRLMQGAKFRHPAEPQRASGLQAKDREMKQRLFGTETPVLQEIEALYWQSVETSSPELTVHYAADLKTNELGSGFPTDKEKNWRVRDGTTAHYDSSAAASCKFSPNAGTTETCCHHKLSPDGSEEGRKWTSVPPTRIATKEKVVATDHGEREEEHKVQGRFMSEREGANAEGNEAGDLKEKRTTNSAGRLMSREAESAQERNIEKERGDAPVMSTARGGHRSSRKENQDDVRRLEKAFPVNSGKVYVASAESAYELAEETAFYAEHPWNLTRFARQQGSLLSSYHKDVAGVTSPWLYVGMVFSTFCWHAEDNYFAACNYHHWGDAKVWYIIPPSRAPSVERMLQRYLNTKDSDYVLHSLTVQLPPSLFIQHRIPVYRVEQKENEFIILWPRTYHAGFNAGFNCNEACNFAPASWLPWGQRSVKSYRFMRSTCIPFHQLLLRAACSAEGLAASQLLHLCQAAMRLLHEEYALRRAAKEEHVATGLMILDSSHIAQLDKLKPDTGGAGAELLGCRRELEHIVGKPLFPDEFLSSRNTASDTATAAYRDIVKTELSSNTTPAESNGGAQRLSSLAKGLPAKGSTGTALKTRPFLEVVAGVASLPVKDCDTCRSCCVVSCFTCPHSIEHNCLECLGQQSCSCKLQIALIRFSLPVLWAIFDHLRSLFLVVCKREEAEAHRENKCDGRAGNETNFKRRRQSFHNVSSKAYVCGGGSDVSYAEERLIGPSMPDPAEHTESEGTRICDTGLDEDESINTAEKSSAPSCGKTNRTYWEQEESMIDEATRTANLARCSRFKPSPGNSLSATHGPDLKAHHVRPSERSTASNTSFPAVGEGQRAGELLPHRETDAESCVRDAAKVERRRSQQKRTHRRGCRSGGERLSSGGGEGHTRTKRKEDELLQDPMYVALPSLEELILFEETALLQDNFIKEYSKRRWEEAILNQDIAASVDTGTREDGRKGGRKEHDLPGPSKQGACFPGARDVQGCTKREKLSGETEEDEEDLPLDAAAPSSVTFEEKGGSLYMKGENWSLTALVSCNEAAALEFVHSEENRADVASQVVSEDVGLQLTSKKRLVVNITSHTSRESSPSTSSQDAPTFQSSLQASPPTCPQKSRPVAERRSRYVATVHEHEAVRGTKEKGTRRRKKHFGKSATDRLSGAEQAMMTLVRQLTWRYFLSALKDEEEDNDERILPVFRKAVMPLPKDDVMS